VNPVLRQTAPEDAHAIGEITVDAWRGAYRGIVPDEFLDAMTAEGQVQHFRRQPGGGERWVVEEDGRVVGFISFGPPREERDQEPGAGEVWALMIRTAAQGRGHGRALLTRATERLAEDGYRTGLLWVFEAYAPGRRFYEAMGWRADGERKLLRLGQADVPALRYRRRLR
jgi:GNAT superfamily N-acetyltransferase